MNSKLTRYLTEVPREALRRVATAVAAIIMLAMPTGCVHKDLLESIPEPPAPPTPLASNVEVVFDWQKAPDNEVKAMTLYMYPDNRDVVEHWFGNPNGGIIKSFSGHHTAVCVNGDDTYNLGLRNHETHDMLELYTTEVSVMAAQSISTRSIPRAPGTENEPLRGTPSRCFGTHRRDIDLEGTEERQTITMYPEELTCHYTVDILDVKNLKDADLSIDGTISSMAGGFFPGKMIATGESVSHTFTIGANDDMKSLTAHFLTFGVPDGEKKPHMLCIYVVMKDDKGNMYTYDVSDQVNNAPDPKNVHIIVRGLELPEIETAPGGGLGVTIGDWDHITYDIEM